MTEHSSVVNSLSILVHADTKVGKTTFANTAPGRKLVFDVEKAARFMRGKKIVWDPHTQDPPKAGDWEICIVNVFKFEDIEKSLAHLLTGNHCFDSVIIDSLTEMQSVLKKKLQHDMPDEKQNQRRWGELLDQMDKLVMDFRDLTVHPTRPITCLVVTAMTEKKDEKYRPLLQGKFQRKAPYHFDFVGYMFAFSEKQEDETVIDGRKMLTRAHPEVEAGNRAQDRVPQVLTNPTIPTILEAIYND